MGPLKDSHVGRSDDLFAFPTTDAQKILLLKQQTLGDNVNFFSLLPKSASYLRGVIYDIPVDKNTNDLQCLLSNQKVTRLPADILDRPPTLDTRHSGLESE